MADALKKERESVVNRLKMQMVMCDYGLPENAEIIGLGKLSVDEARRRLKAIRELWVRLDLFVATGEASKGSIPYPEARRRIDYRFDDKTPSNSSLRFKAGVY